MAREGRAPQLYVRTRENPHHQLDVPEYEFRLVFGSTQIDHDPAKEEGDRKKHGHAVYLMERLLLPTGKVPFATSSPMRVNGEKRG